jgi:hypothetical protein
MEKLNLFVCDECGAILRSNHRHDFQQCDCPNKAFVDGGIECPRHGAVNLDHITPCLSMAEARRLSSMFQDQKRN